MRLAVLTTIAVLGALPFTAEAQTPKSLLKIDAKWLAVAAQPPSPAIRPMGRTCCSPKGMLIGAIIGATLGGLLAYRWCDSGSCASDTVKASLLAGGLFAAIGAVAGPSATHRWTPRAP